MTRRYYYRDALPTLTMFSLECIDVSLTTLFKRAAMTGMSSQVFLVYAYVVATLVLLPAPFISQRSTELPPLNFSILSKIALLGFIGFSDKTMGYTGISLSSPTLASAISNLTPAFTFLFAIIFRFFWLSESAVTKFSSYGLLTYYWVPSIYFLLFWPTTRMERIDFRSTSSQAKILGTIVSLSGALVVTLYKGPPIIFIHYKMSSLLHQPLKSLDPQWAIGGLLLAGEYIMISLWYILQVHIMKEYPNELTVVFFHNLVVSILAAFVCFFTEPNPSSWKITSQIALASIVLTGIFGKFINNAISTWVLRVKGPVFVAMFRPLSIVIAASMGVMFLEDAFHLGSLIGATIITIGFFTVMWGKATEDKVEECQVFHQQSPTDERLPLLQSYKTEKI